MLVLVRNIRKDGAILGVLTFNGSPICWTLENEAKAIPAGYYSVMNSKSPKFKRELPLISSASVPASRGIRIHVGNSLKDTSGCVCVGMGRNAEKMTISDSQLAETMVVGLCRCCHELAVVECDG